MAPLPPNAPIRRIIVINPRFQWSFVGYMALMVLMAMVTVAASMEHFLLQYEMQALELGLPRDDLLFLMVSDQRRVLEVILLLTGGVAVLVVATAAMLTSHRVAGPLYKLQMELLRVAAGQPAKPVYFRTHDHFHELAKAYNASLAAKGPPPQSP